MSKESQQLRTWLEPLAGRVAAGANAAQVADAIVVIWLEIDQALSPILGHHGVAALYNRSLKLASPAHPWLAACQAGVSAAVDTSALKAALLQQPAAQAGAAGSALFLSFRELLASLIGPSLTDRLLRPIWARSTGASPAQGAPS